ncbi:arsinothricin resistance N-acetyltransferase ArsN1 family A [Priestia taiwanensis]|uniref:Phosphinothricin N-acetyltransferase n=1 Tax=Priestia taiwanensis TaxID=1347902 RepID=A0A917ESH9_9BACI|nr:arsinothricin resistance N-acetyltransferase ArsN1 family A [Priestia taiwanensis]MBM7364452.1 phosphinothricin acetyltransferase [Priestia taiwanensis]GGE81363.1 phosphinothricin N-acetyltransferase [Priestia taiwanensis]
MEIRYATEQDIQEVTAIYNEGIEDRIATLETDTKTDIYIKEKLFKREERYSVIVIVENAQVVGWASINPYNQRSAYRGVGEVSIYIKREYRGKGVGQKLLTSLERIGVQNEFYKFVLFTFPFNNLGQGLYHKMGYREVGVFEKQGVMDGKHIDVMIMEKLLMTE